jgi:hypothetical protein
LGLTSAFPWSDGFILMNETSGDACCKGNMFGATATLFPFSKAIPAIPIPEFIMNLRRFIELNLVCSSVCFIPGQLHRVLLIMISNHLKVLRAELYLICWQEMQLRQQPGPLPCMMPEL